MPLVVAIVIAAIVAVVVWAVLFRYVVSHRDPAERGRAGIVAAIVIVAIDVPLFLLAFLR